MKTVKIILILETIMILFAFGNISTVMSDLSLQREHIIELESRIKTLEEGLLMPAHYLESVES